MNHKYVIGVAGSFDSIENFFARMFTSNAAKQLASAALQAGRAKYLDPSAINKWIRIKSDIHFVSSSIKNDGRYVKIYGNPIIDKSIEEYEYHEYDRITGTNLNSGGEIRISIESQDVFAHPSESYLIFEGRLTKADNTAYTNADEIALTNNGIMHLFS